MNQYIEELIKARSDVDEDLKKIINDGNFDKIQHELLGKLTKALLIADKLIEDNK